MESVEQLTFGIEENQAGERLDKAVTSFDEEWSRVRVQEWIAEGRVTVDGIVKKANYRLRGGEQIIVQIPPIEELNMTPEPMNLDIAYEDEEVIVVNKPRGMVVHPGPGNTENTLVHGLLHHCRGQLSGIGGVARPGIVHRIDKDTSGLLMVAKTDRAHQSLVQQLKDHSVTRRYIAVVNGIIPHEKGTIDAPIGRDPKNRQRMAVVERNGKEAITHFLIQERFQQHTLIECQLETGRTHQIRVHMKYIGHPLLGDPVYSSSHKKSGFSIKGQALHAAIIGFDHPVSGKRIMLEAPIPEDMEKVIRGIRASQ
ncbi:RluA family pseudouridine synthase [Risungbinella massiliensis]|uniref:RluA family pseudouridine synthase n=1 Tax=Risungbinella massiliensis TaxID=1329796 RepID=UPI0005CBBD93|nr:RluA family pseudouridine synthase [Risungbinella massiliensis]